ncbi:MAG: lipid IV(A) 3-deoxy-D-manno-octulosonic acid transferase [Betaproteobacteria bacterium]|nr:lipid IV(A) 3-deoxy-D-manno-octulosonic acid transferase [Betaproteobacteria bacterium]
MARLLYTLGLLLLLPWVLLHLLWRGRRQREYLHQWGERFGFYARRLPVPVIWLHAVSVGETRAAAPLVTLLRQRWPEYRVVFTHMTPTGRHAGEEIFGDTVERVYLPYDYPWAVRRFQEHFRPAFGIIMETELWPNLIAGCHRLEIPLLLANARMSEKSARRYARFPQLMRQALRGLAAVAAQTGEDAERLTMLGAQDVIVTGNLKFDITPPPQQLALGARLRGLCKHRPVLLMASTRDGEEALMLDALLAQPIENLLLIIVPRHPQRFSEVADLIAARGLSFIRRSDLADREISPETQVLLGDSMGEMFAYYAASDVAFIGGSLLDYGSQNLIEACAVGVPLLLGPSTYNFAEAARAARACGAARQVASADELFIVAAELLRDAGLRRRMGNAGLEFAARHRGASQRTLALLERVLARVTLPQG